jgi:hypothetical protein
VLHISTVLGHPQATHLLKETLLHCVISSQHTVFSFRVLRLLTVAGWARRFTVCASCVDLQECKFFWLSTFRRSSYVTSSLTRGWVRRLQLLLVLASAVIFRYSCLRFKVPITWRARSPCLFSPGTWWPGYTPKHWVPFSSPPTTRRATVEVFDTENVSSIMTCSLVPRETTCPQSCTPSNGCCIIACSRSCYLAMGLHVTIRCKTSSYRSWKRMKLNGFKKMDHPSLLQHYSRCIQWQVLWALAGWKEVPISWPPRLPDLTLHDFLLLGSCQ